MKDAVMNFLGILFLLAIIGTIAGFATIIILDRYHRSHPDMPQPSIIIPGPPLQDQLIPRVYDHDVKG